MISKNSSRSVSVIRVAHEGDLLSLQSLHQRLCESERCYEPDARTDFSFSEEGQKYFRERISSSDAIVRVAEKCGESEGFLIGVIDTDELSWAKLESVFVAPEARGGGLAEKLIEEFKSWAKDHEAVCVTVAVADENPAIKVYERVGFKKLERKGKTVVLALSDDSL
jgi:GNAT superfamily N-acetyltransferase